MTLFHQSQETSYYIFLILARHTSVCEAKKKWSVIKPKKKWSVIRPKKKWSVVRPESLKGAWKYDD